MFIGISRSFKALIPAAKILQLTKLRKLSKANILTPDDQLF